MSLGLTHLAHLAPDHLDMQPLAVANTAEHSRLCVITVNSKHSFYLYTPVALRLKRLGQSAHLQQRAAFRL